MHRRTFLVGLSVVPILAARDEAESQSVPEGPWPGPSTPRSYVSAHATPSIFSSQAKRAPSPTPRTTRADQASSSANENALSSQ